MMAVRTGERFSLGRELVSVQGKPQQLMRELLTLHNGQRRIGTPVLGMAITAFQLGVLLVYGPVQGYHILHLLGNFTVTVDA